MATLDLLGDWKRAQYAGDLRAGDADKEVVLMGWVHRRRDLGNIIFIDLRDRGGIAQIVFNKELAPAAHARAEELRAEYVMAVRIHHGRCYGLRQSPQMFKQLLMIGGLDRYFQIVRCFRGEDRRADRQPEFTQLDLEMSFPTQETIFGVIEQVMVRACAAAGIDVKAPFLHLEYREAIRRYGIDKPDLRFGMELQDVTEHFAPVREKLHLEGNVPALVAPGAASFSRKQLDELAEQAKGLGARGLYTIKVATEGVSSPLEKTLGAAGGQNILAATGARAGDLLG